MARARHATTDRHRGPKSRAPAYRRTAWRRGRGAPVSDRHRAGARNQRRSRRAIPTCGPHHPWVPKRTTARCPRYPGRAFRPAPRPGGPRIRVPPNRVEKGSGSAGLRPASRESAKPAPITPRRTRSRYCDMFGSNRPRYCDMSPGRSRYCDMFPRRSGYCDMFASTRSRYSDMFPGRSRYCDMFASTRSRYSDMFPGRSRYCDMFASNRSR